MKAPGSRQCIGRFLDVGDLAPSSVVQKGMGELVSDHVLGEFFGGRIESRAQDDATRAIAIAARSRQEQ